MRLRLVSLAVVIALVAISCGVPGPDGVESIDPQDVPSELNTPSTVTTTTSTTTTTTTTIPQPTTTEVPQSTTTLAPTTTEPLAATEPVELYFVSGDGLLPISRNIVANADPALILNVLIEGLDDSPEFGGLRSAIPEDAPITVRVTGGIARVDIAQALIDEMANEPENLLLMFGQIVLTLTSPRCLGQVVFTVGGEPTQVYFGDFELSDPEQKLTCGDYIALVTAASNTPADTTTVPSTSPPATTPPVTTVAPPVETTAGP